jgi:hypothetical protein
MQQLLAMLHTHTHSIQDCTAALLPPTLPHLRLRNFSVLMLASAKPWACSRAAAAAARTSSLAASPGSSAGLSCAAAGSCASCTMSARWMPTADSTPAYLQHQRQWQDHLGGKSAAALLRSGDITCTHSVCSVEPKGMTHELQTGHYQQ